MSTLVVPKRELPLFAKSQDYQRGYRMGQLLGRLVPLGVLVVLGLIFLIRMIRARRRARSREGLQ